VIASSSGISQPYATEIGQRYLSRKAVAYALGHGPREQYLTAVRRGHDSRRAIDGTAKVITITVFDDASMQPAAHAKRRAAANGRIVERSLQVQCGSEGRTRVVENGMDAVARLLDHASAVSCESARTRVGIHLVELGSASEPLSAASHLFREAFLWWARLRQTA